MQLILWRTLVKKTSFGSFGLHQDKRVLRDTLYRLNESLLGDNQHT
ncbi:hypothetical protein FM038_25335 [Shewanella eurypsychrophilus]|uniref:Uncharacterized protein n=1 Tax=Shewanella eurypsychrophilus TaxID=2593656 RepID=A0ABX8S3H8_9GAMM|nr:MULTISPECIES: hypothetical protein [Shewanella]QXP44982.1 hypothetical protein FM038_25335 [Shewanella eurypsychrophilus]